MAGVDAHECWSHLPAGVLEDVAKSLSGEDDQSCRLVCKNWASVVTHTMSALQPSEWDLDLLATKFTGTACINLGRCTHMPGPSEIEALSRFSRLKSLTMPKGGLAGNKCLDQASMLAIGTLSNLEKLDLSGSWLECGLDGLSSLGKLEKLVLSGCRWANSEKHGSVSLPETLTNLKHLDLSSSLLQVSDADLQVIGSMKEMTTISLGDCKWVTDGGISILGGLPALANLDLTRTGLTDRGMETIAKLSGLQNLRLEGTLVGDAGAAMLGECQSLEKLDLSGCYMVTEEGINRLHRLQNLHELVLEGISYFSTRGLAQLSRLRALEKVSFDMPQWIADEEVGLLTNSNSLKSIAINGCKGTCLLWMLSHPTLKEISLTNGRLGIDHIQYLSTLGSLDTLKVSKCEHLSLAAFEKLRGLKNLKNLTLDIVHGSFEKHFIAGSICPLVNLRSLSLSCEFVIDETVADLWRLPKLSELFLEDCAYLTDVGLEFLGMIRGLEKLTLKSSRRFTNGDLPEQMAVTENGLVGLSNLNGLREFTLIGRHAISAQSWGVLNSSPSLRHVVIAVPPIQLYVDEVMKAVHTHIRVKFHATCIGVVE
ncbi:hypothetical protein BSKO_07708 [Bryopsis sp. KO-2023]|nr:hypothetical protein BSKO_07708 [Bryopsis sp. KO-2023]